MELSRLAHLKLEAAVFEEAKTTAIRLAAQEDEAVAAAATVPGPAQRARHEPADWRRVGPLTPLSVLLGRRCVRVDHPG